MKRFLLSTLSYCVCTILAACSTITPVKASIDTIPATCLPTNLTPGLIAFYTFANGSLADATGNGNDLTNPTSATPGPDRNGNPQCAYQFSATSGDYLQRTNPTFLDGPATGAALSISLWYKPIGPRAGGAYELLAGRGTGLSVFESYGEWSAGLYDCRRAVWSLNTCSVWDTTGSSAAGCQGLINQYTNKWQHLVVTYANGIRKIYHNGILTTQYNTSATCGQPLQDVGDFLLGKDFTGYLDDILIYNRELAQAEVLQLNNLPACCGSNQLLSENTTKSVMPGLHLSPNPATDYLRLTDSQGQPLENATITISDALGHLILNLQSSSDGQVSLSEFPTGLYICIIRCTDGNTATQRLIVTK
jgi:hypothetical protein